MTPEQIIEAVAELTGLTVEEMIHPGRQLRKVHARTMAAHEIRRTCVGYSLQDIGNLFGMEHGNVAHSLNRHHALIHGDPAYRRAHARLESQPPTSKPMSTKHEITGTIKIISEAQSFASGFTKRQFVVTDDDPKYPQDIPLEFVKDGCVKLDAFSPGDRVTVAYNLRGNERNGRHYLSLAAWKIERADGQETQQQPRPANQNGAKPPSQTATADALDEDDDIPF